MAGFDSITGQATSIPGVGSGANTGTVKTFIPELWSDEVRAVYENSIVTAPLVKKMSMKGKKGDTIHVPAPLRGTAVAKVADTAVVLNTTTESEVIININQHYQYSRMIEDIADVQALSSLRRFYTEDAGYALARQVDTALLNLGVGFGDGDETDAPATATSWQHSASYQNDGDGGLALYVPASVVAADVITDKMFRGLIQVLDDNNNPMTGRSFVVAPSQVNVMRGIDRFVSSDFVNGNGVETGKLGTLYGVDIYMSTNIPTIDTDVRPNMMFHKDALILAEQVGIRSQTQYMQEHLSTLYTADRLYGKKVFRAEAGVVLCTK